MNVVVLIPKNHLETVEISDRAIRLMVSAANKPAKADFSMADKFKRTWRSILMQVSHNSSEQKTFSTYAQILGHERYGRVYIVRVIKDSFYQKKRTNHKIQHKV